MKKAEFINTLRAELKGYPHNSVEDSIQYYSEMIDDRMEDGMSEDEAVAKTGDPIAIAKQIKYNMPFKDVVKEKFSAKKAELKEKDINVGLIILLILGAPLWMPLAITVLVIVFSFFVVLWVLDVVLYIVSIACALGTFAALIAGIIFAFTSGIGTGLMIFGCAIAAAGTAILLSLAGVGFAKAIIALTASFVKGIKRIILGK